MKLLPLCLVILLCTAAVADAATFKGRTSQGRVAVVETNDRGFPVRFFFRWNAKCDPRGTLRFSTGFHTPFRERTRDFVRDGGPYSGSVRDPETGRTYRVRVRRSRLR